MFQVSEGMIQTAPGGPVPTLLRTLQEFGNFRLVVEYQTPGWCEAGVLLFAPPYGRASHIGVKIHLRHDNTDEGARSVGALFDLLPPLERVAAPRADWNRLEVISDYPMLRVTLNGTVIQNIHRELHPALRWRQRRGHLALQYLGSPIRFRKVEIEPLPEAEDPWVELCNGRDLEGWEIRGNAPWEVRDGVITSPGGDGYLVTTRSFSNFVFETFVRTRPGTNGGVFFRWGDDNGRGYEVQIYNVEEATNPTGSIYGFVPAAELKARDGEWFHLRLVSSGTSALVFVNGDLVAVSHALKLPDHGKIALQMHSEAGLEFLRPRIRPLK
ncbi:MAG: hypothetical protein Kow00109_03780 [Acidobacteriota bacterium]